MEAPSNLVTPLGQTTTSEVTLGSPYENKDNDATMAAAEAHQKRLTTACFLRVVSCDISISFPVVPAVDYRTLLTRQPGT